MTLLQVKRHLLNNENPSRSILGQFGTLYFWVVNNLSFDSKPPL